MHQETDVTIVLQQDTVLSRYIVDLETWSTSKHSLGKKTKVEKGSRPQKVVDLKT